MAQSITREAFVELLHDYVRDALQQRLQDKHSSHFALYVPRTCMGVATGADTRLLLPNASQAAHELRPPTIPASARGKGAQRPGTSLPLARTDAFFRGQATIKALTQHVSLVDHVAHEELLLKARPVPCAGAVCPAHPDLLSCSCLHRACGISPPTSPRQSPPLL